MAGPPNAIEAAIISGLITCRADTTDPSTSWASVSPRLSLFRSQVKSRLTLFLGSAISSFKPAKLPMWNHFIELLWTSLLRDSMSTAREHDEFFPAFMDYFNTVSQTNKVPNYMITEIIARRFGKQYLALLEAFSAQKSADGSWAVNHVHRWAAQCLAFGSVAAIMTTNFDDYLEKAIEDTGAPFHRVTGNHHIDGPAISAHLRTKSTNMRLVLVVNGANAFSFVRSLMPQLGAGKMTFLFKLHGSCYERESCIDTRLQRAQGLPSYLTDVIDTLLQRSVWFVAGFSGSDMNDNLNYLRLLSNKPHARVVWLHFPGGHMEEALKGLMETMDQSLGSANGLALLHGCFSGERTGAGDEFPLFDQKVKAWASKFGSDWCRLVILDLIALFRTHIGQLEDSALLDLFKRRYKDPRQDWNEILEYMDLTGQESQVAVARLCREASEMLEKILDLDNGITQNDEAVWCTQMSLVLEKLNNEKFNLQSAALVDGDRPHAQSWVVDCLSGLILLCGDQVQGLLRALDMSSSTAWMVGDFETHELIGNSISSLVSDLPLLPSLENTGEGKEDEKPSTFTAFITELDNVNAKMNAFGVPPELYVRALLNRSILFSDGFVCPPNILANSSVFVNEVLFQKHRQENNLLILKHLYPMLPSSLQSQPRKLQAYRRTRAKGHILEPIFEDHIRKLDEYFDQASNSKKIIYYDENQVMGDYGVLIRKQIDQEHAEMTAEYLVQMWNQIESGGRWNIKTELQEEDSVRARAHAHTLIDALRQLLNCMSTSVYRSALYHFADLFDEARDPENFIKAFPNADPESARKLLVSRDEIIDKPWVYGPFCRELFDVPYKTSLAFGMASRSELGIFVFLAKEAVSSWDFMSTLRRDDLHPVSIRTMGAFDEGAGAECSALLLSQATSSVIAENRVRLSPIRDKLAVGTRLTDQDKMYINSAMRDFTRASLQVEGEETKLERLARLSNEQKACAKLLLGKCVFLIRRGPALDRMYQEATLSVPGVATLRRK